MAHNVSLAKHHSRIMAGHLSDWTGAWLAMRCNGPGHPPRSVQASIQDLEAQRPGLTVGQWRARLRCVICRRPPVGLSLRVPAIARQLSTSDRWTVLAGPGTPGEGPGARDPHD